MKKLFLASVLATAITPALALASSTDLTVTGTITPEACTPSFAGGGNVYLGKIPAKDLNETTQTELPAQDISLQITCISSTTVAIKVFDNRATTALPGIIVDGISNSRHIFGMGAVESTKIGGYGLRHGIPTIDGVQSTLMWDMLLTNSWQLPAAPLVAKEGGVNVMYSWGDSISTGPAAGRVHHFPMSLVPVIGPSNALPITADISIDGAATFELVYL
jgi:hypothetical protein